MAKKNTNNKKNGNGKKKKSVSNQIKSYALPGSAGLTFYAAYKKRASDLGTNTETGQPHTVFSAIMYDLKNFNATEAMQRVQKNLGEITTPLVGAWGINNTRVLGKHSKLAADILTGMGLGVAGKTILDPPVTHRTAVRSTVIAAPQQTKIIKQVEQSQTGSYVNPYL